ncbi:Nodulin-like domain-containing protein [Psidium guajava]|nr:Nodulin-like domain-containing protein [Psidium guajava]
MRGNQHEQAHCRHGRPAQDPGNGCPHQGVAQQVLGRPSEVDHPRPATAAGIVGVGVEEAGEDAAVGAEVLEDGDGVEGGLRVALGGLEGGRVDGEGVQGPAGALDQDARHGRRPLVAQLLLLVPLAGPPSFSGFGGGGVGRRRRLLEVWRCCNGLSGGIRDWAMIYVISSSSRDVDDDRGGYETPGLVTWPRSYLASSHLHTQRR